MTQLTTSVFVWSSSPTEPSRLPKSCSRTGVAGVSVSSVFRRQRRLPGPSQKWMGGSLEWSRSTLHWLNAKRTARLSWPLSTCSVWSTWAPSDRRKLDRFLTPEVREYFNYFSFFIQWGSDLNNSIFILFLPFPVDYFLQQMPQAQAFYAPAPLGGIRPTHRWTQPPHQHSPGHGLYQMAQLFRPRSGTYGQGGQMHGHSATRQTQMGRPMQGESFFF